MTPRRRLAAALVLSSIGALGVGHLSAAVAAGSGPAGRSGAAAPTPGYVAVTPKRLMDTRRGVMPESMPSGGSRTVQVTGRAGVPDTGVAAVVLNVTGITQARSSFLTVFPNLSGRPVASNLNLVANAPRANQVIVGVGPGGGSDTDGWVRIYNASGPTHLIVDILGYFPSTSSYSAVQPFRALDTRSNGGAPAAAANVVTATLTGVGGVPASGVSAVVVNLTGISTRSSTFVTAYAHGTSRPGTSNLNLGAGETGAVLAVAPVSADGRVDLYNSGGPTHLIVDIEGFFSGTGDYTPVTPSRLLDTRTGGVRTFHTDEPLQVSGVAGVPSGAGAAILTVTMVRPTASSYLTVHPHGTAVPPTSNINSQPQQTVANLVVAQLSSDGRIDVYDAEVGGAYLVDVVGWLRADPAPALAGG